MKLRSLECLTEIVACDFNLTRAAKRLCASQPAVTRQIQLLEQYLGFEVLLRRGNRIFGLTAEGRAVYERAARVLHEARQLKLVREELREEAHGKIVVATTHVHARYTLLPAIKQFRVSHPHVSMQIISGDPASIARLVLSGEADFGLSAEAAEHYDDLVTFPCYRIRRLIITPRGHPLTRAKRLSLALLAKYPLIVYDKRFSSGWRVLKAFEQKGITPNIVLSAIDAAVLKAYVAAGLGIAVIQQLAYDPASDHDIVAIDPGTLFESPMSGITLRRGSFLRSSTLDFLRLLAPNLDLSMLDSPRTPKASSVG
jgi:LysR family transcriptional regulator, cys regulon transcriptional activator